MTDEIKPKMVDDAIEIAEGLQRETLYGALPIESTMKLADAVLTERARIVELWAALVVSREEGERLRAIVEGEGIDPDLPIPPSERLQQKRRADASEAERDELRGEIEEIEAICVGHQCSGEMISDAVRHMASMLRDSESDRDRYKAENEKLQHDLELWKRSATNAVLESDRYKKACEEIDKLADVVPSVAGRIRVVFKKYGVEAE